MCHKRESFAGDCHPPRGWTELNCIQISRAVCLTLHVIKKIRYLHLLDKVEEVDLDLFAPAFLQVAGANMELNSTDYSADRVNPMQPRHVS